MSDAEVICAFMEPKPDMPTGDAFDLAFRRKYLNPWWLLTTTGYDGGDEPVIVARSLGLDALREVEARLTEHQSRRYDTQIRNAMSEDPIEPPVPAEAYRWHVSAERKIKALATVLRPLVEGKDQSNA